MLLTINQLQKRLHEKHLSSLNVYRFIRQDAFQRAYMICTEMEQANVARIIDTCDLPRLITWTKGILKSHNEFDYLDVRYLRELVQALGIRGYAAMSRSQLISVLMETKQCTNSGS
jgi:hypothetical protein